MVQKKKRETLIVYGDCQAYALIRVIHCIREVAERFELRFHRVDEQSSHYLLMRDEIIEASFVLLQDLDSLGEYPYEFISYDLRPQSVVFPRLAFAALWPFSTEFGGHDKVAERLSADRGATGLIYFDTLLGLLRTIPDKKRRYSTYKSLQPVGDPISARLVRIRNVQRIYELECLRLNKLDERFEMSLGRHIIQNFRHKRLFHTVKHPTVELIYVLATQILDKLGLTSGLSRPLIDSLDYYQIPIHPIVARTLDANWVTSDLTYTVLGKK